MHASNLEEALLVQKDARPAGSQNHFHLARWSFNRIKLDDGLPRGIKGKMLWRLVSKEKIDANSSTTACCAFGRTLG